MKEPLISVIIPIYNMEFYLERCVDSVLNNTYQNLEVICVDDGSTDHSLEILRRYEAADPRIVVIAKENGGVSSARNAGLDRMTGEYVTFIDSDDFVHPQYVELLYRAVQDTGTSISICTFQKVDDELGFQPEALSFDTDTIRVVSYSTIAKTHQLRAYSGGRLICSRLTSGVRFRKDLQYGEDTVFFAEICANEKARKYTVLSLPLYYYFQRGDSLTKAASAAQQTKYIYIVQNLLHKDRQEDIYLEFLLRVGLSLRHWTLYFHPDRSISRECAKILLCQLSSICRTNIYTLIEKIAFSAFILFPRFYWLYRFVRDPSILNWEKTERKKWLEAKKKASE